MGTTWEQFMVVQPLVAKMLTNSIKKNRISHAYLFEGSKGTGKLDAALQLTKSVFCEQRNGYEPCQLCRNCRRIMSGNHPNVHIVKPEGTSIKKQQVQTLQEEFAKTGVESNQKVYIIEHADRMTTTAANTLLKFLEEPHTGTMAILLTENSHKILNTILSRCQTLTFQPLVKHAMVMKLEEKGISKPFALTVAQLTNNIQEAEELCNDEWFAQARTLVIKLCEALGDASSLFFVQEKWLKHFTDKEQIQIGLDLLLLIYKDLLYVQLNETENITFIDQQSLFETFSYSQKRIVSALSNILEAKNRLNANVNVQLTFEQLVLRLQEG
ncbi:DNA polymerase III subunit delta' [Ectobacillus antri]|jgi:DNA polymerase-3 subunit delta'|uniref:DNA polymerase III subunit delta' n=1 Tax=Ectobacillus antri TaxID=2486280 RepID=A0ABT6H8H8_9BACI|nr:DNA polymerase III subunit delta' [Ectobacillus antri]MDG4658000.1 DNA polymerase III subunit delta' [Ectobacillus antri]MDG5755014.1 DNA polymerase III subunit delta' [Ectobacillus antri]